MGCCSARLADPKSISVGKIAAFAEDQKMNITSCHKIRKIPEGDHLKASYTKLCEDFNIQVPFEVFSLRERIFNFELKAGLLLLSSDPAEKKLKLFKKIAPTDRQKLRFFEWKYQIINEKLPKYMIKMKVIDSDDLKKWVEVHRCTAAEVVLKEWKASLDDKLDERGFILSII